MHRALSDADLELLKTAVRGVIDTWEQYIAETARPYGSHTTKHIRAIAINEIKKWTELLGRLEAM